MTRAHGAALAPFVQGRQAKTYMLHMDADTACLKLGPSHAAAEHAIALSAFCPDSSPDFLSVMLLSCSLCAAAMECLVIR